MGPQAFLTPDPSGLWINLEPFHLITMENKGSIDKNAVKLTRKKKKDLTCQTQMQKTKLSAHLCQWLFY